MSDEFEPYEHGIKNKAFSEWEYQDPESALEIEDDHEQILIDEREQLIKEAIDRGYAEGMSLAREEIESKKNELQRWIDLLLNPVQLLDEQLTQELIQTVIALSQHCISVELSINPEKIKMVLEAIKEELPVLNSTKIVTMHPFDVHWIKAEMDDKSIPGLHDILEADPALNRGDFIVKSEFSELDGRLQTRLTTLFAKYINNDSLLAPIQEQD